MKPINSSRIRIAVAAGLAVSLLTLSVVPVTAQDRNTRKTTRTNINKNSNTNVNRNTNVNTNTNVNRNTNVNVNRNVNVNVNTHGGYYGGYHNGPTVAGVVAATIVTAAVIGAIVSTLPPSCTTLIANGITYQNCGGTYYQPQYRGSSVTYVVVAHP